MLLSGHNKQKLFQVKLFQVVEFRKLYKVLQKMKVKCPLGHGFVFSYICVYICLYVLSHLLPFLTQGASIDEIRSNYKHLARKWHPDKQHGNHASEESTKVYIILFSYPFSSVLKQLQGEMFGNYCYMLQ